MKDNEKIKIIQTVFRDVLSNKNIVISRNSTPEDIEGWDSLVNINIVVALEEHFNIKFSLDEITNINSVEDIVKMIESHLSNITLLLSALTEFSKHTRNG